MTPKWLLLIIGLFFTRNDALGWLNSIWILVRAFLAGAISYGAWTVIGRSMPFAATCVFGTAVAMLCSMLFRLITPADFRWVIALRKTKGQPVEETPHETPT